MRTNAAAYPWQTSLAWSAVFRAVGLSIFGLIIWFWLFSEDSPARRAVSLVAAQALAATAESRVEPEAPSSVLARVVVDVQSPLSVG